MKKHSLENWFKNLWKRYGNYSDYCSPCVHNDVEDQICVVTGNDKRNTEKCNWKRLRKGK